MSILCLSQTAPLLYVPFSPSCYPIYFPSLCSLFKYFLPRSYHFASFLSKKPFRMARIFSSAASHTRSSSVTFSGSSPSLT
ncbi:unnamed protein product [Diplocarpon coronariae]